jgi:hypothetical protein
MRQWHPKDAFKCKKTVCNLYFRTKAAATQHYEATHSSEKNEKVPYLSCDSCNFQTRWRNNLESHIGIKHFPRTLKCPECPKMLATEDHIYEHARKTHSKNRKTCPHCGLKPALYNSHVVNTKCIKCCKPFKCFALLKKHDFRCKLSFVCDDCKKIFESESLLLDHFNTMHRYFIKNKWLGGRKHKGSEFKCEQCKIYFAHEGFYNSHFQNFHIEYRKVTCHHCGKLERNKRRLENHLVDEHLILERRSTSPRRLRKSLLTFCMSEK